MQRRCCRVRTSRRGSWPTESALCPRPPPTCPVVPTSPTHYAAFMGDLVDSRNLPDRAGVQKQLRSVLDRLNTEWSQALTVPLRLTAGDEVQGLTRTPEVLVDVMVGIADALFPVRVVWGLGLGPLTTELVQDVSLLDGPCFHRAREAVEEAKRSSRWLRVGGVAGPRGFAVAALMSLVGALRSDWTHRQAEVVAAARGRLQIEVAEALEVHASTISRTLAAAHYESVLEGEAAARALLESLPLAPPHTSETP